MALPPEFLGGIPGPAGPAGPAGLDGMGMPPGGPPGMMQGPPPSQAPEIEPEQAPRAPTFPDPEPLDFSDEEQEKIAQYVTRIAEDGVKARNEWAGDHMRYDQMFRGAVEEFSARKGPWEGSSHLHVQMPYWLVDAIQARLTHSIWSQTPLVQGYWEETDDESVAKDAALNVEWHLQPKRMDAYALWARSSKIRLIHGSSVALVTHVHDTYSYRTTDYSTADTEFAENPDGTPLYDDITDEPVEVAPEPTVRIRTGTRYRGPVLYPYEWDDVIAPVGCMNLQPNCPSNPGGADWVVTRQFEYFSLMRKKATADIPVYSEMFEKGRDEQWWHDNAPGQSRSGGENNERIQQQDKMEGINRTQAMSRQATEARPNPEFEVYTYWGPYEHPDTGEQTEMVFFVAKDQNIFLGGFLLSDMVWTGKRPLLEMHYQTVSNRFYSMGVCEIVDHLSQELDTLHNLRVDVGYATNLPWYFVRASSYIRPSEIKLRPMALIPVDNPRDIVAPQVQNVTSFYHQEESLLLTIVERVMGITDLFLGVSPTSGASARHATGFLGTKQEAEARMSGPLTQDERAFSFLCGLIYDLEMQFGPQERSFRLEGEDSSLTKTGLTRDDLWFRGQYDFRLGANVGMFSQNNRFERAQTAFQIGSNSPLTMQEMGRRWELEAEMYKSMGYRESDVIRFIGPKSAVSAGTPVEQDEENSQMSQFAYGLGKPAPVHPSDDDQQHLADMETFEGSDTYRILGGPNPSAFSQHKALHYQQMSQKQQQAQMQQMQAAQGQQQQQGPPSPGGASPQNRANAQIGNVTPGGASNFAQTYQTQTAGNGGGGMGGGGVPPPPNLGG